MTEASENLASPPAPLAQKTASAIAATLDAQRDFIAACLEFSSRCMKRSLEAATEMAKARSIADITTIQSQFLHDATTDLAQVQKQAMELTRIRV